MKIEAVTYLVTTMVGLALATGLWFAVCRRLSRIWLARLVAAFAIAASVSPTIFPPLFGSFWEGTVSPAVLFIPSWLGQVVSGNADDSLWGMIYFILPIFIVTAVIYGIWSATAFLKRETEKPAT